jgi:hypothetical protein
MIVLVAGLRGVIGWHGRERGRRWRGHILHLISEGDIGFENCKM